KPGSDVGLLLGPVSRRMVDLAHRREQQIRFIDLALGGGPATLQIPFMGIHCRRNFLTLGFVGSLQKAMAQTERDGEVGANPPGVLKEVLRLVGFEMARYKRAVWLEGGAGGPIDHVIRARVPFGG